MDLLGSIMSKMDKPPTTVTKEEREAKKERRRQMENAKVMENKRVTEFKEQMRTKVEQFMRTSERKLALETMTTVQRAMLHEIAEDAGLTALSFGEEGVDRHIILWKKEFAPCDDEVACIQRGDEWTEEKAQEIRQFRAQTASSTSTIHQSEKSIPKRDYHAKYNHLISLDVGKNAAHDVTANKQYGNVRLENKKDKRTIEETLAERRSNKKLKSTEPIPHKIQTSQASSCTSSNNPKS